MRVAVIGAGPAGLMAAEAAAARGASVHVFEQKRSAGRKLLVAGKGGLNLTHGEPLEGFLQRYREARPRLEPFVRAFPPDALRAFADALGQSTWVGSSGRVFPRDAKAAPLLRAWIARLKETGVRFFTRRRWHGWKGEKLAFECPERGLELFAADATVLALGGASWPETGSDARWVGALEARGVAVSPFLPANAGWITGLPEPVVSRAGAVLKSVALYAGGERARGDVVVTRDGIEGTPVYRLGPIVRAALAHGPASVSLDLKPDSDADALAARIARGGSKSRSTLLKSIGLGDAARILASAIVPRDVREPETLARRLKDLPLAVTGLRPVAEAISTAGGVRWSDIDERLMLSRIPGVFVAGEMIDWEAPTGGYLLQACFSTGRAAGDAAAEWALARSPPRTGGEQGMLADRGRSS